MSYILDALRKADAQREAGAPRGLHAQAPGPGRDLRRGGIRPAWALGALAMAAVAAVGVWWAATRDAAPVAPPAVPPPPAAATPPSQRPAPPADPALADRQPPEAAPPAPVSAGPQPSSPPPGPPAGGGFVPVVPPGQTIARPRSLPGLAPGAAAPAEGAAPSPVPPPAAPPAPPAPPVAPAPVTERMAAPPAPPPAPAPAPAPAAAVQGLPAGPAVPAGSAAEGGGRVHAFAELPPDVQQALPKLQVSGGVHSPNPAQRMLIVGGQVYGEGSEVAPGVVLEQVRPRTAVLRFRGWRYAVPY